MSLSSYASRFWKARYFWWHLMEADLRARFRRTALGMAWAMLQPMLMAGVIAFVLQHAFKDDYSNYFVYVYLGMIMWEFFTGSINLGADSLIRAEGYIKQVKQPVIIYPFKSVLHGLVVFFCGILGYALLITALHPDIFSWTWVFLPVFVVLMFFFCVPVAIISAIINIQFRDFRQSITVLIQIMWFASPVLLKREVYEDGKLAILTTFNPLTSLLDLLRDPMLLGKIPSLHDVLIVSGWAGIFWLLAAYLLARHERKIVYYF
jgi:lipopolysaccharide transport system permease protein